MTVILDGLDDFTLETLERVAWDEEPVAFGARRLLGGEREIHPAPPGDASSVACAP